MLSVSRAEAFAAYGLDESVLVRAHENLLEEMDEHIRGMEALACAQPLMLSSVAGDDLTQRSPPAGVVRAWAYCFHSRCDTARWWSMHVFTASVVMCIPVCEFVGLARDEVLALIKTRAMAEINDAPTNDAARMKNEQLVCLAAAIEQARRMPATPRVVNHSHRCIMRARWRADYRWRALLAGLVDIARALRVPPGSDRLTVDSTGDLALQGTGNPHITLYNFMERKYDAWLQRAFPDDHAAVAADLDIVVRRHYNPLRETATWFACAAHRRIPNEVIRMIVFEYLTMIY
jgi:hypothetical protein